MNDLSRKDHWEKIYSTKALDEVGWFQKTPAISLELISYLKLPKTASIIDIGGGDSFLATKLLAMGYTDITVLDLSAKSIERAQNRLEKNANKIKWIVSDILNFKPEREYDCWHDRAAFHFLIEPSEIKKYVNISETTLASSGGLILGTFSTIGPKKCSGLDIQQYDNKSLSDTFERYFTLQKFLDHKHITPSGNTQNYIFGVLRKNEIK